MKPKITPITAFLILAICSCANQDPERRITVKEACTLPPNYEVRVIKSPEFIPWKTRDRKLKAK